MSKKYDSLLLKSVLILIGITALDAFIYMYGYTYISKCILIAVFVIELIIGSMFGVGMCFRCYGKKQEDQRKDA